MPGDTDTEFSRKVKERGVVRGLATKAINAVNDTLQDVTTENHDTALKLLGQLQNYSTALGGLDDYILKAIVKAQYDDEVAKVYEYRSSLSGTISLLEGKVRTFEASVTNSLNQSHASADGDPQQRKERIPELELTKFDGNPLNYQEFWDDFSNSVDNRSDISTITKFKLLRTCLVGTAASTCKAYQLTEANYEQVKSVLEERYGDKETAIALHLGALVKLRPAATHSVSELVRIRDECEAHIRALVILGFGEDTFGQLFAPIVLEKLPKFVRLDIRKQKKQSGDATWTMKKLREILSDEIELRQTNDQEYFGSGSGSKDVQSSRRDNRDGAIEGRRSGGTASTFFVGGKDGKDKPGTVHSYKCAFCEDKHPAYKCDQYKDVSARQDQLAKLSKCFQCLGRGHSKRDCPWPKKTCFYCGKPDHHSSLCLKEFGSTSRQQTSLVNASPLNPEAPVFAPDNVYAVNTVSADGKLRKRRGTAILESALVMVVGTTGSCMARVVFDNGSTKSYMSAKLASRIGAKRLGYEATAVGRFGETTRQMRQLATHEFAMVLRNGKHQTVEMNVERNLAPSLTLYPFDLDLIQPFCKTEDLAEIIVEQDTEVDIDILLGLDYYYSFVGEREFRLANGLILKQTSVGFVVTGFKAIGNANVANTDTQMLVIGDQNRDPYDLEKFWQLEEIGIKDDPSTNDDETALRKFNETVKIVDGRYSVQWPFKSDKPDLPTNYNLAQKRLKTVHRRLMDDVSLLDAYDQIFKNQQDLGIIEDAPKEPQGMVHYLCHHAVLKPQSATTKVRLVFDASARSDRHSQSLNDAMYRGPTLMNDLCGMLIRFRLSPVAIVSDVEKAFYQVDLQTFHRDCTRFLWLKDPSQPASPDNVVTKRYKRVLFGATASPFLLAATINHHMKQMGGPIADEIVRNTYVDNVISGQPDTQAALRYYEDAKNLFSMISMNLREWFSNDQRLIAGIADPDRGKSATPSVLGLKWSTDRDTLSCTVGNLQICGVITKRAILKSIASMYDPCGWFGPIVVRGKLIMQSLWSSQKGWDDPVDSATLSSWLELANDLRGAAVLSVPRYIGFGLMDGGTSIQLHCFCDTSTKAYGAAVYLRVQIGQKVTCNLLMAKSRVTPLAKKPTIPRLELIAAVVGTKLLDFVSNELSVHVADRFVWSDSTSVLGWLRSEAILTVFVSNRIKTIKTVPNVRFMYVPTGDNPADIVSRGSTLDELKSCDLWWHGPDWLQGDEQNWPDQSEWLKMREAQALATEPEMEETTLSVIEREPETLFDLKRYGSVRKLHAVTARVFRALTAMVPRFVAKRFPQFQLPRRETQVTAREMAEAKMFFDRRTQLKHFASAFRPKPAKEWLTLKQQLGLFIDKDGLIRCRGRFKNSQDLSPDAKFPKLLPKKCLYTDLVAMEIHRRVIHQGPKVTLAAIRSEYWIPHGRLVVKRVLNSCNLCRLRTTGPFKIPDPPPLPDFRVSVRRPFACIGLDYLGPLWIMSGSVRKKVWVALYTCSVIRAIHLEVVSSLTTSDFLLSLRRFVATYGKPDLIVSDNAKQFKLADGVLQKLWLDLLESNEVQSYTSSNGIEWKFITELSPWMGGFYERMVRPVKDALRKSLGSRTVSGEELQTLLMEIAAVVNNRPLVYVDDDPGEQILTPANLMFRSTDVFPEIKNIDEFKLKQSKADDLLAHWKQGQKILRRFWDCWRNQYLLSLRERPIGHKQRAVNDVEAEVGMTVLIKEALPRGMWRMGRITNLIVSKDESVRSAEVLLSNGNIVTRPLKLLCPLEKSWSTDELPPKTPDLTTGTRPKRAAAEKSEQLSKAMLRDRE